MDCLGSLGRLGAILVCMEAFWGILAALVLFLGGLGSLGCISEVVWESLGPPGLSWRSPWALELTAPRKSENLQIYDTFNENSDLCLSRSPEGFLGDLSSWEASLSTLEAI